VKDYILPGLFLLGVMGTFPLILVYGLWMAPRWSWLDVVSSWSKHHWAWSGTVLLSVVLLSWLGLQAFFIGFRWPIQYITLVNGILLLGVVLLPGIENRFRERNGK
jgi:hypothetical protein